MLTNSTLFLFRNDLRLSDNAALAAACKSGQPLILFVYSRSDRARR